MQIHALSYHEPGEVDGAEEDGEHNKTSHLPRGVGCTSIFHSSADTQPGADTGQRRQEKETHRVSNNVLAVM